MSFHLFGSRETSRDETTRRQLESFFVRELYVLLNPADLKQKQEEGLLGGSAELAIGISSTLRHRLNLRDQSIEFDTASLEALIRIPLQHLLASSNGEEGEFQRQVSSVAQQFAVYLLNDDGTKKVEFTIPTS